MENVIIAKEPEKSEKNTDFSFYQALKTLLGAFPKRSQEIIGERYGLTGESEKTLEEIGSKFHITRERVRQIIKEAAKKIKNKSQSHSFEEAKDKIVFTVSEKSGIIKEEELMKVLSLGSKKEEGAIRFFVEILEEVELEKTVGEIEKSVVNAKFNFVEWREVKNKVKEFLTKEGNLLDSHELERKLLAEGKLKVSAKKLLDYLAVSSEVRKNKFEKWGLADWEEVNPKGTREKAYLVLKETKKPLHFRKISDLIDQYNLSKKKTNPQTVHNELIKDNRFVLVGRGIYALREWGYKEGTVKDLLKDILSENQKPMSRKEILDQLLKMRQVKRSTIVINLNNFFARVGKDEYTIKK